MNPHVHCPQCGFNVEIKDSHNSGEVALCLHCAQQFRTQVGYRGSHEESQSMSRFNTTMEFSRRKRNELAEWMVALDKGLKEMASFMGCSEQFSQDKLKLFFTNSDKTIGKTIDKST